jgi:hypothetical protein
MRVPAGTRWVASAAGLAAGAYAANAALCWYRYGHVPVPREEEHDALLDRFMPRYDVVERHRIGIRAPAGVVYAAACEQDLQQSCVTRAVFKTRELVMGAKPDGHSRPAGLVALCRSLGWGVLTEEPGREIVMGAATQPWVADPVFRAIAPDCFAAFDEPDYVKIVWTLRADPAGDGETVFRTETRAIATDPAARAKFRWYWALASPGIALIRWMSLAPLKREAECRAAPPCAIPARSHSDPS